MITSTGNPKIRSLVNLKRKAKERNARDVFLAEGIKMFQEVPADRLEEVFASDSFAKSPAGSAALARVSVPAEIVSDSVFQFLSDTQSPQGILAVVRQMHYTMDDLSGPRPLLVILENLQDPGNLGTIVRTAEGAGVTGILCGKGTADIYSPKVTRSTMGSIFRVPFLYSEDLPADIRHLKAGGIAVYAAHLQGSVPYCEPDYTGGTAFLIGNESRGLTEEISSLADGCIRIPMHGKVESLNAAVSASILMYEACRQRDGKGCE